MTGRVDFCAIAAAARVQLPFLCRELLPGGRREGSEWVALNPRRYDRRPGSFKVNLRTGCWADFATGDRGRDAVSLLAYVRRVSASEAARVLARGMGACGDAACQPQCASSHNNFSYPASALPLNAK